MTTLTGIWVLLGVFALGGAFALWNARLRGAVARRLEASGFEPCDAEPAALARAWQALVAATGRRRDVKVGRCHRRAAGWGMLYHVDLLDVTHQDDSRERVTVGAAFSAYLLDVRDPDTLHRAPVTLLCVPGRSKLLNALLRRVCELEPPGASLEIGDHPWVAELLGAYGAAPGKLDEVVPPGVQQRLARAGAHGFFRVCLAEGKLAFAVLPGRRDVDRELAYLAEWT